MTLGNRVRHPYPWAAALALLCTGLVAACDQGPSPKATLNALQERRPDLAAEATAYDSDCRAGKVQACFNLAALYDTALTDAAHDATIADLFDTACDDGSADACFRAGVFHLYGFGVERAPGAAAASYRRGCELGHDLACRTAELVTDTGFAWDETRTDLDALRARCDQGVVTACDRLRASR